MATKSIKTHIADQGVEIQTVRQQQASIHVLGTAPLILNRLPEKARQQLLLGSGRKTAAEKAGVAKHDPFGEFRSSIYRMNSWGGKARTILGLPASAFKGAMETAALETPGAKKAQIGRLVQMPWHNVELFGEPRIMCAIVRSADMAKTPDVRSRAVLPEWACTLNLSYVTPTLALPMVVTLLMNAGIVSGVGDWRQEKGSGSFGSFRVVEANDADFLRIVQNGGASVQESAMANPEPFDDDTRDLLEWFGTEVGRRGLRIAA